MFWQKLNSVWRRQSTWFNVWWGGHPYLFSYSQQDNEVLKYFHSCPQRRGKIASIKTKQSAWAKCGTKYVFKAASWCCFTLVVFIQQVSLRSRCRKKVKFWLALVCDFSGMLQGNGSKITPSAIDKSQRSPTNSDHNKRRDIHKVQLKRL